MSLPAEPAVTKALDFAKQSIREAVTGSIPGVAQRLLDQMRSANTYRQRGQFAEANDHVLGNQKRILQAFETALAEGVAAALDSQPGARKTDQPTDWKSIGLVDDGKVEERLSSVRIGQLVHHACETELVELDGYMSGLLRHGGADPARNPLRGEVLGSALHKAIERSCEDLDIQKLVLREFGAAFAQAMPQPYRRIIDELKRTGVRPDVLAVRPVDPAQARGPGAGPGSQDPSARWERSWQGVPPEGFQSTQRSALDSSRPPLDSRRLPLAPPQESVSWLLDRLVRGGLPGDAPPPMAPMPPPDPAMAAADLEFMSLLRRINGRPSDRPLDPEASSAGGFGPGAVGRSPAAGGWDPQRAFDPTGAASLTGQIAINLIHAHQEELKRAATGRLDHLVIEVVSGLFDQIFSDNRVAPQMARLIARLQLPVLRVALRDPSFFESRRHPVRRFINRIASLANSYDAFEDGQGRDLLERVAVLVGEIVDGDFDRIEVYEAKLAELERYIGERAAAEVLETAAAATLKAKELEWHTQQRFSWRLNEAIEPLGLPPFIREFLAGDWGQAIVLASHRDGERSAHAQQLRRTAVALVKSLQPQRTLEERRHFLAALPGLMAELKAGMAYVGLSDALREDFLDQLVTQHAGSLKAPPRTDLDQNLMLRHLERAFSLPIPSADEMSQDPLPEGARIPAVDQHFSQDEGRQIGLIAEAGVDWAVACEPEPDPDAPAKPKVAPIEAASPEESAFPQIVLPTATPEPASDDLASSTSLVDELQLGLSYQLNLQGQWERIRLTYMSPSRTLFLFNHGDGGRKTISMTRRTLGRLCEASRMRALERAPLIDRSADRARRHLAQRGARASVPMRPGRS